MKRSPVLRRVCVCALFSALMCALSPITIPIGPIPLSLSILTVLFASAMLGPWSGVLTVAVYLALGAVGLPVFGGGMSGFGVLIGPTGGFLWSYLPMCVIGGYLYRFVFWRTGEKTKRAVTRIILGGVAALPALMICYLFGTVQYMLVANVSLTSAIAVCVLPFLAFDLCKLIFVALLSDRLLSIGAVRRMLTELFA